jgi:phosphate transport system permease protein
MSALSVLCAFVVVLPLGLVLYYLLYKGIGSVNWAFFTQLPAPEGESGGGMGNAILGSLELMGLALLFGMPIGLLGGVYLSEYGSERINFWIRFGADVLNGVPSIVWGMVAYELAVMPHTLLGFIHIGGGFSAYAGGLALGFIMIPLVLRTTEEVLVLVPAAFREAGLALGIPRWKITVFIVLRTAIKGLVTGVLLALGRIAGETAPLMFTAFGNLQWSHGLNQPIAALPLQIFSYAISPYDEWHRQAWAGALVLIFIVFCLSLSVRFLSRERK